MTFELANNTGNARSDPNANEALKARRGWGFLTVRHKGDGAHMGLGFRV